MITQEEVNYIKSELAKGNTKEVISKNLISRGGWTQIDVDEAFKSMEGIGQATPLPVKPKSKLLKFLIIFIILIALSALGYYLYSTNFFGKKVAETQIPILPEVVQPADDNQIIDNTNIVPVVDENVVNQEVVVKEEPMASVGDYEIKILTPSPDTKLLTGQHIEIKVLAGKFIEKILYAGLYNEPVKIFKKNDNGIFVIDYTIPLNNKMLGRSSIYVGGSVGDIPFDELRGKDLKLHQSVKVNIDSSRIPISLKAEHDPLTVKVNGEIKNGLKVNVEVVIAAMFSDLPTDGAVFDSSVGTFKIADTTIAILDEVDFTDFKVLYIRGLKVGTTKLTASYKGLSKVIDVIVEN